MSSSRRLAIAASTWAVGAASIVAIATVAGAEEPPATSTTPPPTERVLLGAPDPAGPTARGVFLADPEGQIEHLTAGDHLVAWSVRTPADPLDKTIRDPNGEQERPYRFPTSSRIVVVDERGGAPLTVDLGRRIVIGLDFKHGIGGTAEPRVVVDSCSSRKTRSCTTEVLQFTPQAPLSVARRITGKAARAAARSDVGRTVVAERIRKGRGGKPVSCVPRLRVRDEAAGTTTRLPAIPDRSGLYPMCVGFEQAFVTGTTVLAYVRRADPEYGFEGDVVYAFELGRSGSGRWRDIAYPYRYTDGSTGYAFGPGITSGALYWEEVDGEGGVTYSLGRVRLPDDIRSAPKARAPVESDPIAPDTLNACAIAATESAIYELGNPRCAWEDGYGTGPAGEIRRVVNPGWRPEPKD